MLLFALWVLRRTRHDTHDITGEGAAEWQAQLRQKDLEIARINEELVTARHAADHAAHTATNTIRSYVEHTDVEHSDVEHAAHRSATGTLIEDAGLVAAGAVAGATVAKSHTASTATHPTGEAAADLHDALRHKDEELDRVKTDLAAARLERERQHDASGAVATIAQTARPIVDTAKAEEAGSIAAGAAVVGAAATTAAHHSANHSAAIDEADWSITHYRVVIGEARAQKHDRPLARSEVIRLSELMLAHYPDDAEAVSFARVSKAEALAEGNDHASALMECETVIAHYASSSNPAVRTQLAHAHFLKAAVHAQHKDVAQTSAALDQWATVYGIFDQRMVTEDNRFRDIMNEPEFQSYVAQKLR